MYKIFNFVNSLALLIVLLVMVSCSHAPYEKITDGLIVPDTLPSNTELKIIEENDAVVLQTANLQARIMLNTGEVSYDGNECIVDLSAR